MKKKLFKILAIVLTTICIVLSGILIYMKTYAFKNEDQNIDLNSKIMSEIDFVDSCVIEAMNKLNNITVARYKVFTKSINKSEGEKKKSESKEDSNQSKDENQEEEKNEVKNSEEGEKKSETSGTKKEEDKDSISVSQSVATNSLTETNNDDINWDEVTYIYENLYSTWPTINMDLKQIGVKEEQINKFNIALNGVAQSINSKDKNSTLVNLNNIYVQLPNYLLRITQDSAIITLYNTKVAILNAYTLANEENKWKEINESITNAKKYFSKMYDIIDEKDIRRPSIEIINTLIKDLENSIILNDKNIFFMQYKNTIQAIETLDEKPKLFKNNR
ncbi:MAG: hypothetical protein IKG14_03580 [Clostridia bacterium]|nr:hypothetical protein [Clostridia bacterium]